MHGFKKTKKEEMSRQEALIKSKLEAMNAAKLSVSKRQELNAVAPTLPWQNTPGVPPQPLARPQIKKSPVVYGKPKATPQAVETFATGHSSTSSGTSSGDSSQLKPVNTGYGSQQRNYNISQFTGESSNQYPSSQSGQNFQTNNTPNQTPSSSAQLACPSGPSFQTLYQTTSQLTANQSVPKDVSHPSNYQHTSKNLQSESKPGPSVSISTQFRDSLELLRLPPPPPPSNDEPDPTIEEAPDTNVAFWSGVTGAAGTFNAAEGEANNHLWHPLLLISV